MTWYNPAYNAGSFNIAYNASDKTSFDGRNFLPNQLAGNELWLAGDGSLDTTGALVDSWNDLSGNDNDCTASGAARPTLTANQINGKPAVVFSGAQALAMPSALYPIPVGDHTIFSVSSRASEDATIDAVFGFSIGANNATFSIYSSAAGFIQFKSRVTAGGAVSSTGNTNTNFNIIRTRRATTTQAVAVNGSAEVTNANGENVASVDSANVGSAGTGAFPLTGDIAELIVYSSSLSSADIAKVENYLSSKYNIALV